MIGFLNNPHVVSADRTTAESPLDVDPEIGA